MYGMCDLVPPYVQGENPAATIELVTNYIDAPSAAAKMALERAKELLC